MHHLFYSGSQPFSKGADDVSFSEIIADIQKRAASVLCDMIREAIAEIERCRVDTLAPEGVAVCDAACKILRDRHRLETQSCDQLHHLWLDVPSGSHDQ